jgi:hypothetical protein
MTSRAHLAAAAFLFAGVGIFAALRAPAHSQTRLEVLVAKIETQDPSLDSYRASIDFAVGLHSFPYIRKSVRGTAYYKRPDRLELVMEKLPSYARSLEHIFVGLGPPETWSDKFDVTVGDAGTRNDTSGSSRKNAAAGSALSKSISTKRADYRRSSSGITPTVTSR